MSTFECTCCCNNLPIGKSLVCPRISCGFTVCVSCQKTTLALAHGCMSCKMVFTNKFLIETLGKTFVNGPLRKFREAPLYEREKALLADTQPLVEWERIRRAEMAKIRFRKTPQIPPRPIIGEENDGKDVAGQIDPMRIIFPCPKSICRGFVVRGACGVCNDTICVHCREVKNDTHTCDPDTVQNICSINTQCRSCPQCATMIYRTEGCNHMCCTACRSHFDWDSGRLLEASSNHHYDNAAAFATNIVRRGITVNSEICEEDTPLTLMQDYIPRDVFEESVNDAELLSVLYDDVAVVRKTKTTKFNERTIVSIANNNLISDRVKYMLGELTEAKWKSRIYHTENYKTLDLHIAEVLNIYLSTVRDFQSYTRANVSQLPKVKAEFYTFICMINESFFSLHEEYGGPCIVLRTDFSNPCLPAIVM